MFNPISTYRIQFHKDFTLAHLQEIIPYLSQLGIKTLYASPIFKAVPGSNHGYDGTDPLSINPEIGTLEKLVQVSKELQDNGIKWLQDIVPNHMAFHYDNIWLMDLLEKGPLSVYRNYFDQSLSDNELFSGPLMVPFLGDDLEKVIEDGQLQLGWNGERMVLRYAEQNWPVSLKSYPDILEADKEADTDAVGTLLQQLDALYETTDADAFSKAAEELKLQLTSLVKNKVFNDHLLRCFELINADKQALKDLATTQYYRLCNWKETDKQINYRRFFTVNGLICLNIQRQEVFDHVHQLVATLLKDGVIHGLRIDHIDGLFDPEQYLHRLRALAGDDTYIVVEKILEEGEELPVNWPIQGSTGYDYLALVNNLFTHKKSEKAFSSFYTELTGDDRSIKNQIYDKKALILSEHMNGELENLTSLCLSLDLADTAKKNTYERSAIKKAIGSLLIHFPVYRFYGNAFPLNKQESVALKDVFNSVGKRSEELQPALKILVDALIHKTRNADEAYRQKVLFFYQRCMQLTGPLMAKGVEDTLMYTYNRFIDHNEVGDSPEAFGISVEEFHQVMKKRQQQWPLAINATATHDTKRGEGVRARLNALTGITEEWLEMVKHWQAINADLKTNNAPDANDEYFIYQTLIGSYPMPGEEEGTYAQRLEDYLEKMLREAKRHSNWAEPNQEYEDGVKKFAAALLNKARPFWQSFSAFHQKVSELGISNTLAQATLKLTCPGVPDVYQGCEHWDLSFVDPDNRRPVDYALRRNLLSEVEDEVNVTDLWKDRYNGQIKVWLVSKLLKLRAANTSVFSKGEYVPLDVKGSHHKKVLAFARAYHGTWLVVIVPAETATVAGWHIALEGADWGDTRVVLPANAPAICSNALTSQAIKLSNGIMLQDVLNDIPLAVLKLEKQYQGRSAGVLMHITSLPSAYGIGDLGSQAYRFAQMLHDSCQQYWQILPLNATSAGDGHSPYSSYSSQAGNTLLISPEQLHKDGLLSNDDLKAAKIPATNQVDFKKAEEIKTALLDKAWENFNGSNHALLNQFEEFCTKEASWIEDYALYLVLKQQHGFSAWNTWANEFKLRNQDALSAFATQNANVLRKVKWLQFIFHKQWAALKDHCNQLGIKIFGDLPFYISYDSADVWAAPEIFDLDENLQMNHVSGVPPDFFNADGQRWGMPIFKWDKLKELNYDWWLKRIRKTLEWYDLLRLDHFRAFSAYWSIPATDETAVNGEWIEGPAVDFFNALKQEFGSLPFVAEDLGDIDQPVYDLKDGFGLPGMKVLQFSFGDDVAQSAYAPHHHAENYFVYTGTHDNNTTLGWFDKDADSAVPKNLSRYTGIKVSSKNINKVFIKMALASVCKTAIIPVQDWLNLDEQSRMNTPAGEGSNWTWRLTDELLAKFPVNKIKKWTTLYNRC
ncbi:malto-oligosyltrehalose synthase [Mucilaginibacter terrenus]|uniref:4-alpha-glucanotransferase n=1 Tax=Mucilaginibacter terrenus TaxID=2482727 RepID=A0A3E2NVM6_9SPHI|nr:malto-oligosyltrehalose synthase [Mucilaginibacter terrenus]RFZ85052.1 malto-oligosyltrehalose synthase [Mucilaginibacter terrenus]